MSPQQHPNAFPWALNDEGLALLTCHLQTTRPNVALEFGSGKTTPIFRRFAGHTLSLEHLPEWGEKTAKLCEADRPNWWQRLTRPSQRTAELRIVSIGSIETPIGPLPVYDTTLPAAVDFALIDGPPKSIGRRGVMFQLFPSLTAQSVVWLDDVNRPEETEILALWEEHFPLTVKPISDRIAQIQIVSS